MRQFFEDDNGNLSSMRLYCFIALLVAVALAFTGGSFDMVILWLVSAFAPKSVQKFIEVKPK